LRVAIIKLSAMGDIIHAMVVLEFIKKRYPKARIDWLVEEAFMPILQNNPSIDTILPLNLKSIKKDKSNLLTQIKLLKTYAKNSYDVIIDAQGLLKSAISAKLIATPKSVIVGFDRDSIRESMASWFYDKGVEVPYGENVIVRNATLIGRALDIEISSDDILSKEAFLYTQTNPQDNDYILLVVGASRANKIYPKEQFLEVVHQLDQKVIVVWGNEIEQNTAAWLQSQNPNIHMAPKGNLESLKAWVRDALLVIGGDTGPTHMAWAMNVPSITLFGNTPSTRNTYTTSINKTLQSNTQIDAKKLDKNDFSIQTIEASKIAQLARELLSKKIL